MSDRNVNIGDKNVRTDSCHCLLYEAPAEVFLMLHNERFGL